MKVFKQNYNELVKSLPVNVMELGFDNTGVKDNTELFAKYTALYPLYFPSGEYLFNDTIRPKKSIYGEYSFQGGTAFSNNFTRLKSKANGSSFAIEFDEANLIESMHIEGFVIDCMNTCGGIGYHTNEYGVVTIDHVTVSSLGTIGFDISPKTMQSRCVTLTNCMVYSAPREAQTIAYHFGFNAPDCTMSYCYSSMPRIGIKSEANILTLSDVHLWGGWTTKVTDGQWQETKGLYLEGCTIEATNLYVDTFFIPFYATGTRLSLVNVSNLTIWFDESVSDVARKDGSIMYGSFHSINVNGGYGYFSDVMPNVFRLSFNVNNFVVVSDETYNNETMGRLPYMMNNLDQYSLILKPTGAQHCELCAITLPSNCGSFKLSLYDNYGNQIEVRGYIKSGVMYCEKTTANGNINLKYSYSDNLFKLYGDYNKECNIRVYIQSAIQCYPFSYNVLRRDRTAYQREYLSDTSSLTVVNEKAVQIPAHTHDEETGNVVTG